MTSFDSWVNAIGRSVELRRRSGHDADLARSLFGFAALCVRLGAVGRWKETRRAVDESVVRQVQSYAEGRSTVLVMLDSNHTHDHVLRELQLYARFVTPGSYLIVYDTIVERMPDDMYPNRPWRRGDNPLTAVKEFLAQNADFEVDHEVENKLLITVAPGGYLRRIKR